MNMLWSNGTKIEMIPDPSYTQEVEYYENGNIKKIVWRPFSDVMTAIKNNEIDRANYFKPRCVLCDSPVSYYPDGTPTLHCFTHKTPEENEEFNQAWRDYVENK
jgi:hypothetical protein